MELLREATIHTGKTELQIIIQSIDLPLELATPGARLDCALTIWNNIRQSQRLPKFVRVECERILSQPSKRK